MPRPFAKTNSSAPAPVGAQHAAPLQNAAPLRYAFTLVEILVVVGITAVLFFLLLGPLINSFRLTERAQMLVSAQDAARRTLEILTRELGSAAYVFDNTSHPFSGSAGNPNQYTQDRFSNFLDIQLLQSDGTVAPQLAHAYNAKLDLVLPRHNASGGLTDPTTGEPITIQNGSAVSTGLTFPLAPSISMVRYWVGLRDPTKPYATQGEGSMLARSGNNTYVLYRAQFQPSNPVDPNTNKTATNPDGTTINEQLFAPQHDANGNAISRPEFDDPDFFLIVKPADPNYPNWLDPHHAPYNSGPATDPMSAAAHNARVQKWFQLAKPVISSSNTDLILLPHNRDNTLAFGTFMDPNTGNPAFPNLPASGEVQDPVTGSLYPVVNMSISFRFGSVSADASAATSADYASAGYGSDASANNGLPYVPTVYTATDQSWAFPYHISLYQYSNTASPVYETSVAQTSDPNNLYAAGDLMEMYDDPTPASAYPVYDISTGKVLTQNNRYIPMVVNPDTATINFDTPALPDPNNPYNRFFYVRISDINAAGGLIDLSQLGNATGQGVTLTSASTQLASPLPAVSFDPNVLPPAPTGTQVANARIVPGSVRVNGPDAYPGPNYGLATPYSEVFAGNSGNPSDNQFEMDYAHNAMRMYVSDLQSIVAVNPNAAISIAFDYQANLAPNDTTNPISAANPASPMLVKVDYQTRDLLDINLGVRVYDPNNVGPAQVVTVHNQVRIGNSNR